MFNAAPTGSCASSAHKVPSRLSVNWRGFGLALFIRIRRGVGWLLHAVETGVLRHPCLPSKLGRAFHDSRARPLWG